MGATTGIAWTDSTWSPWRGCEKVSPACDHCYAETWARRTGRKIWGKAQRREIGAEAYWKLPYTWNAEARDEGRRRKVFCSALSDVFEGRKDLDEARERVWTTIERTPWLVYLLLTKRPENILRMIPYPWRQKPPQNVWYGTTAESQEWALKRIPALLEVPAVVRFLSCEPVLGPIYIASDNAAQTKPGIHWVIAGGESGSGARPTSWNAFRSLRDQARMIGAAFFMKQSGIVLAKEAGHKGAGTDPGCWPEDLRIQEFPPEPASHPDAVPA